MIFRQIEFVDEIQTYNELTHLPVMGGMQHFITLFLLLLFGDAGMELRASSQS
jgi:hypothetical protein